MGGRGASSATAALKKSAKKAKPAQKGHEDGLGIGPHSTDSDAIASYLGLSDKERAKADYDAVTAFTGSSYSSIRESARTGGSDTRWKQCEDFIANAPQWAGGTTYRGVNLRSSDFKQIKVGEEFPINGGGPASWSTKSTVSDGFAGNSAGHSVVFISKTQSAATSIKGISHFSSENEVLVSKDTRYRVTGISKGYGKYNNRTYVEVEVI